MADHVIEGIGVLSALKSTVALLKTAPNRILQLLHIHRGKTYPTKLKMADVLSHSVVPLEAFADEFSATTGE